MSKVDWGRSGGMTQQELEQLLLVIPNAPHRTVPDGAGAEANPMVSTWGEKPSFGFAPRPHWEIGEALGILGQVGPEGWSRQQFLLEVVQPPSVSSMVVMLDQQDDNGIAEFVSFAGLGCGRVRRVCWFSRSRHGRRSAGRFRVA